MNRPQAEGGLRVRVCIPHYANPEGDRNYGSGQADALQARGLALARCLGALLDLQRGPQDCLLDIGSRSIQRLRPGSWGAAALPPLSLEITVCTDGVHRIEPVLQQFQEELTVVALALDDPRHLALACRDLLLAPPPPGAAAPEADLFLYLEDDLVIRDPLYFDKMAWFLAACGDRQVLMPQRYERLQRDGLGVMLVDGPLRLQLPQPNGQGPQRLQARFQDQPPVWLETPANPHAGTFCVSRSQVQQLRGQALPRVGFVGPLETAATLTVLRTFAVLKPAPEHWRFLSLEHAHRAFSPYQRQVPEFSAGREATAPA